VSSVVSVIDIIIVDREVLRIVLLMFGVLTMTIFDLAVCSLDGDT
jgi:hypothetical protein